MAGAIIRQMRRLQKLMDKDPKKIVGGKRAGKKRVQELEEMRNPPKEGKKVDKPVRNTRKKRKEEYENTIDMLTGNYKKGGMVKRDGCAVKGKTKGRMV